MYEVCSCMCPTLHRDKVVLVTASVSVESQRQLFRDGWVLWNVATVPNPGLWGRGEGQRFPPRFWAVYTKLLIFNLTNYDTSTARGSVVLPGARPSPLHPRAVYEPVCRGSDMIGRIRICCT